MTTNDAIARVHGQIYQLSGKRFAVERNGKRTKAAEVTATAINTYSDDEITGVVSYCWNQWRREPDKIKAYFDPVTMFRPRNFERYLANVPTNAPDELLPEASAARSNRGRRCDDQSDCPHTAVMWVKNLGFCRYHANHNNRGTRAPEQPLEAPVWDADLLAEELKNHARRDDESPQDYTRRMIQEAGSMRRAIRQMP